MTSDTVEQRMRNLEIRALAAERVVLMLAFEVALDNEVRCTFDKVG